MGAWCMDGCGGLGELDVLCDYEMWYSIVGLYWTRKMGGHAIAMRAWVDVWHAMRSCKV